MTTENFNDLFRKNFTTTLELVQDTTSKMIEVQTKQFELVNKLVTTGVENSISVWSEMFENRNSTKAGKQNNAADYKKNGSAAERKTSVVKQTIEN